MTPREIIDRYYAIAKQASTKAVAELTDEEKAALALAAGVPVEWDFEEVDRVRFTTMRRVGFAQIDGRIRVVVEARQDGDTIRVGL